MPLVPPPGNVPSGEFALESYECHGEELIPQEMGGDKARAFTEITEATRSNTV